MTQQKRTRCGTRGERRDRAFADEEVEALGKVKEADLSIKYIAHFTKAVELYQKKNKKCFGCRSSDHIIGDFQRIVSLHSLLLVKAYLNMKEGMAKKGG